MTKSASENLARARADVGEARGRIDSLLASSPTPPASEVRDPLVEMRAAIARVANKPMHEDVRFVLDTLHGMLGQLIEQKGLRP